MKKKLQKIIKDPIRVEKMHRLQRRIKVLSGRVTEKIYTRKAYEEKAKKELADKVDEFVDQINSIGKGGLHLDT